MIPEYVIGLAGLASIIGFACYRFARFFGGLTSEEERLARKQAFMDRSVDWSGLFNNMDSDCIYHDRKRLVCRKRNVALENGYAVFFHCGGCKHYRRAADMKDMGRAVRQQAVAGKGEEYGR